MPTHLFVALIVLILGAAAVFSPNLSQNPQAATGIFAQFPFQGRLTNTDGTVVSDASYDATFQLYTVDTGGAAVWTESHTGGNQISTNDGVFSTLLGSITSLTGIDFNQDEYWLGISVGADAEMTPRIRLGAAPYAFNTDKLDGVSAENFLQLPGQAGGQTAFGGTAASENLVLRSTSHATKGDILLGDDGGTSIGIGLADPFQSILGSVAIGDQGIHLDTGSAAGHILIEGNDPSYTLINNTGPAGEKWTELFQSTSGFFGFYSHDDAGVRLQANGSANIGIDNATGNVGVGISLPTTFKLEVAGHMGPSIDDTYNLGSSSLRWQDLYLGPASLHLATTVAETATVRDWKLNVDETNGGTDGDLRIQEGSNSYFSVTTAGNTVLGSGALATTATNGFLYTPGMAGTPTGAPTGYAGRVPMTYDTSANILYYYNSGWQAVSGGGGGISGSGAAGRVTVWNGASSVTSDAEYLWDSTANALSIGTTPSTTGTIRIPYGNAITSRNSLNTADINLLFLANNTAGVPGVRFGNTGTDTTTFQVASETNTGNAHVRFENPKISESLDLAIEGQLSIYNTDSFTGSPALSGTLRLPYGNAITARNSLNTADINLLFLANNHASSPGIRFGNTTTDTTTLQVASETGSGTSFFRLENPEIGEKTDLRVEGGISVYDADTFGSSPSTTGALRLPNSHWITARNAGDSADVNLLTLNGARIRFGNTSTDTTTISVASETGSGASSLNLENQETSEMLNLRVEGALALYEADAFGSAPATSGIIRLPNNHWIAARNAANSTDINLMLLDTSNRIRIGNNSAADTTTITIASETGSGASSLNLLNFETSELLDLRVEGSVVAYNTDAFGSAPATTGAVRLPNSQAVTARNAANSADVNLIYLNGVNQVTLGADTTVAGDYYDGSITSALGGSTLCITGAGLIGTCASDARLKTNIAALGSGLDVIEQLSPKTYDFISGQTGQSGFLAQDVQQLLPGLVTKDTGDDYLSLNYNGIVAYTVKAIQELNSQVADLEIGVSKNERDITVATVKTGGLVVSGTSTLASLTVQDNAIFQRTLLVRETITAEQDVIVKRDLQVEGSILGSKHTRGINIEVPENAVEYTIEDLTFADGQSYAVSITPSWVTDFAVPTKTATGFTVRFAVPAPADATFDYFIQR